LAHLLIIHRSGSGRSRDDQDERGKQGNIS
jgi:hypothetical protein